jgi:hypothetical protein
MNGPGWPLDLSLKTMFVAHKKEIAKTSQFFYESFRLITHDRFAAGNGGGNREKFISKCQEPHP